MSVKQKKVFIYQFILSRKNKINALLNKEMFDQVKWFVVGRVIQFLLSVSVHSAASELFQTSGNNLDYRVSGKGIGVGIL